VLYFREGWNYLLELYFWIIIGALLLVSLTILLARPSQQKYNEYNYDNVSGKVDKSKGSEQPNIVGESNQNDQIDVDYEEELTADYIEKIERRRWALGFVIFGSAFTMFGSILLFLSDLDFIIFLGSCMIYIGIIALIKGASFELQKDKVYYNSYSIIFLLIIFLMNFIMLTELLEVIGTYAWAVASMNRKIGDLSLVYLLPYIIWKIVPTFGASEGLPNNRYYTLNLRKTLCFFIFNYFLFLLTSIEIIFWPVMKQYTEPAIQVGLFLILINICTDIISQYYYNEETNE
tara:strand:- start:3776 stop:4645 length:870 start_codon:yes stop_codon:yes gene_type:complete